MLLGDDNKNSTLKNFSRLFDARSVGMKANPWDMLLGRQRLSEKDALVARDVRQQKEHTAVGRLRLISKPTGDIR